MTAFVLIEYCAVATVTCCVIGGFYLPQFWSQNQVQVPLTFRLKFPFPLLGSSPFPHFALC